jgi:fucose 4-O-acetylase-like acetyltransferase
MMSNDPLSRAPVRTQWLDGAKGIGIMLVVYGHAARALYPGDTAPAWARMADRVIYAFHMPLFFLVAGLFVWPSLGKGRARFAADKLQTIVYPYVLWSLIEGGLEVVFAGEVNSPVGWRDLASIPVVPIEQFWFLYVLALCLLLALACYPYRFAVAIAAVLGLFVVSRFGGATMGLRTLAFFPYVAAGILFAAPIRSLGGNRQRAGIALTGGAVIFTAGIMAGWDGVVGGLALALAGIAATLAAAVLIGAGRAGTTLALLGRASLAIYVMHTIFSAGLRIIIKVGGIAVPTPLTLVATTAAGVAGPLGVWLVAERWGVSMPLGLGRAVRQRTAR